MKEGRRLPPVEFPSKGDHSFRSPSSRKIILAVGGL
jgi:hypothetical protein